MPFGICPLSIVPLRSSSSHKSEMVSQLLFGETVEILNRRGSWLRIRCIWDNYLGWIDSQQITPVLNNELAGLEKHFAYNLELVQPAVANDHFFTLTLGARLPFFDGLRFLFNGESFNFSGQAVFPADLHPTADLVLKIARRYLHTPYLWGGRTPMGIDCSGFTQMVFKIAGIKLPRDAYQQVACGELIDFIEQTLPGDLAFFENKKGRIAHVGIMISDDEIIHAHGKVRIDKIDHYGIFNLDQKKYSHRLRVVKRVLPKLPSRTPFRRLTSELEKRQVELF